MKKKRFAVVATSICCLVLAALTVRYLVLRWYTQEMILCRIGTIRLMYGIMAEHDPDVARVIAIRLVEANYDQWEYYLEHPLKLSPRMPLSLGVPFGYIDPASSTFAPFFLKRIREERQSMRQIFRPDDRRLWEETKDMRIWPPPEGLVKIAESYSSLFGYPFNLRDYTVTFEITAQTEEEFRTLSTAFLKSISSEDETQFNRVETMWVKDE